MIKDSSSFLCPLIVLRPMLQDFQKQATHSSRWRWRRTTLEISSPSGELAWAWRCLASSPLGGKSTWQGGYELNIVRCYDFYAANKKNGLRWYRDAWAGQGEREERQKWNLTLKTIPGAAAMGPCLWNFLRAGRTVSCMGQHWNTFWMGCEFC